MTSTDKKVFIALVIAALALLILTATLFFTNRTAEAKAYNNGICNHCGGRLEQVDTWFDRTSGHDFHTFKCNSCGEEWTFSNIGESF